MSHISSLSTTNNSQSNEINVLRKTIYKTLYKTDIKSIEAEWKKETGLSYIPYEDINYYLTNFEPSKYGDNFDNVYLKILKLWAEIINANHESKKIAPVVFYPYNENYDSLPDALKDKIKKNNLTIKKKFTKAKDDNQYNVSDIKKITTAEYESYNYEELNNSPNQPKISWFFQKNNSHGSKKFGKDKYNYTDIYIDVIKFIIDRVKDLLQCSHDDKKGYAIENKTYYSNEGAHEFILVNKYINELNSIIDDTSLKINTSSIDTIIISYDTAYEYLYKTKLQELLEKNKLFVHAFLKSYKLSKKQIDVKMTEELMTEFETFLNANDKIEYKLLQTCLPPKLISKCFTEIDTGDGSKIVLSDAYKKMTTEEWNDVHNNLNRQIILGFYNSLRIYTKFKQWYWLRNATVNKVNCSHRTEWSQSLNNFYVYLFTLNDTVLFPVRFTIRESKQNNEYFTEDIRIKDDIISIFSVYITNKFIEDYTFLGITSFKYIHNDKKLYTKYFFYFYKKDVSDDIIIIDERGNKYDPGHVYQYRPVTTIELTQIIDYSKGKLFAYRFKKNERDTLPEEYKNILLFTRIPQINMTPHQKDLIKSLNLEQISFERKMFYKIKYYVIKVIQSESMSGGSNTELKLNLINEFVANDRVSGIFYDNFEKIAQYGFQKVAKELIYLYLYPFSGYQYFWRLKLSLKANSIKPIYEPFTYDFYSYNELYKLYINKSIKNVFIIGNSPSIIEVLQYYNHNLENSAYINVINYKTYDQKFEDKIKFDKQVIQFINKHNINIDVTEFNNIIYDLINQSSDKYELFIYNNFDPIRGFGSNISHYNTINLFVGMICGLKYTAMGGTFILDLNYIINKNAADIYLICKKYFSKSYLYYPEVSNNFKKKENYAIFKGFKGIPDSALNSIVAILKTLQNHYPNGPEDVNIYEPEIRARCKITKPITGPRKPYIYGFLNTDINDDIYNEIISYNNSHYVKQLDFVEKLDALIKQNKSEKELLSQVPTNEQIFHSLMYMRKWDLAYNESLNTNKLIQSKIGTQILNDIYGAQQSLVFPFKSDYEYINVDLYEPKKKRKSSVLDSNIEYDISMTNIMDIPNGAVNQQLLTERNKYYNKMDTTAYKLIKAYQYQLKTMLIHLVKEKYNTSATVDTVELIEVLSNIKNIHTGGSVNNGDTNILSISNTRKLFYNQLFKGSQVTHLTNHDNNYLLNKSFEHKADLIILQDEHILQKNIYIQILSALISINNNGSLIIKLKLPLSDYPLINLLYILYNSFKTFKIIKPMVCTTEFYIIACDFNTTKNIDYEYLYNIAMNYDKTYDILLDEYPDYFVSQFKFAYEAIIDNWILNSRKIMFLFDNYKLIDTKTKKHIKESVAEKASDWLKQYHLK